jgi:hypothetical protein
MRWTKNLSEMIEAARRGLMRWKEFYLLRPERGELHEKEAEWLEIKQKWEKQRDIVVVKNEPYEFDTCFDLHMMFSDAHKDALKKHIESLPERHSACRYTIRDGYFAPLYLVAGLNHKYEEKWPPVIEQYGNAKHSVLQQLNRKYERLLDIQLYQFFCWLIWGPSIAICKGNTSKKNKEDRPPCPSWHSADHKPFHYLQYGYGDEGNSILMCVGTEHLSQLSSFPPVEDGHDQNLTATLLATRAQVTGWITYKDLLTDSRPIGYNSGDGAEVVLTVETEKRIAKKDSKDPEDVLRLRTPRPKSGAREGFDKQKYYGAYIWVMFCICKPDTDGNDKNYVGVFPDEYEWMNLLPYFVHGNLGEEDSYNHVCELVAMAAARGASRILNQTEYRDVRLVYVATVDDSNCGSELLFENDGHRRAHQFRILEQLWQMKANWGRSLLQLILPPLCDSEGRVYSIKMPNNKVFPCKPAEGFEYRPPKLRRSGHYLSGCKLPEIITKFMDSLDDKKRGKEPKEMQAVSNGNGLATTAAMSTTESRTRPRP